MRQLYGMLLSCMFDHYWSMLLVFGPRIVWVCQINRIESVQRKFAKRLPGYDSLDYKSRLMRLHTDGLELILLRCDLSYNYKVVFGLVYVDGDDVFTLTSLIHSTGTLTHPYKLFFHCDQHKYFY